MWLPGIACGLVKLSIPMSEVGTAVLTPSCTCTGCREHFWGAPKPFRSVHGHFSSPLLQHSPLLALNALPSPQEDLSGGFFWKKQDELYREDYYFPMS